MEYGHANTVHTTVEMPQYRAEIIAAMEEARSISRNPDVPGYSTMEDLKRALEE